MSLIEHGPNRTSLNLKIPKKYYKLQVLLFLLQLIKIHQSLKSKVSVLSFCRTKLQSEIWEFGLQSKLISDPRLGGLLGVSVLVDDNGFEQ
jgi:hypothetical protein